MSPVQIMHVEEKINIPAQITLQARTAGLVHVKEGVISMSFSCFSSQVTMLGARSFSGASRTTDL